MKSFSTVELLVFIFVSEMRGIPGLLFVSIRLTTPKPRGTRTTKQVKAAPIAVSVKGLSILASRHSFSIWPLFFLPRNAHFSDRLLLAGVIYQSVLIKRRPSVQVIEACISKNLRYMIDTAHQMKCAAGFLA